MKNVKFSGWKKRNKMSIQVIAFLLAMTSPFFLFSALNNSLFTLAGILFGAVTLAMVLVAALT